MFTVSLIRNRGKGMASLINLRDMFSLQSVNNEIYAGELMELNEKSAEHGLVLTREQALELIETRSTALRDTGRVEIGIGAAKLLVEIFSASTFITPENYAETLNELLELFYYMKTESHDKIGDRELAERMFDLFEHECGGSVEQLQNTDPLYRRRHRVNYTYDYDAAEEDEGEVERGDYSYLWGGEK